MNTSAQGQLRTLRTLVDADHVMVFAQRSGGTVVLIAADPPQLPSQPFMLKRQDSWPSSVAPVVLDDAETIQQSPVGWILAGARGHVVAVASDAIEVPEVLPADSTSLAMYLLWREPRRPPAHIAQAPASLLPALREQLRSLQQYADYARSGSRLSVLLGALPHGVVLTDEQAGTALVNAAAAHLLEVPAGVIEAQALALAMQQLHERMSNAGEVKSDARALFSHSGATRINWVWEVVHPERRTLLVSTLPVMAAGHRGRLWSFHDVTALRAAEAEQVRLLRQLERERTRVSELLSNAPALIVLLRGADHVIEFANEAVIAATGGRGLTGRRLFEDELPHLRDSELRRAYDDVFRTGTPWRGTAIRFGARGASDAREVYLNLSLAPVRDSDGTITGIFVHGVDVTEQVHVLEQLRQAQKMETMGRLTGGVAHDFNNLLTVIGGNTDLLLAELAPTTQAHADATEVREAVRRAADLTRQLLTFSRRQVLQRHVVEIDQVVHGVERLLRRLIGEHILLITELGATGITVMADSGQLEQVLLNLAVNARDAMPHGGTLTIATRVELSIPPGIDVPPELRGPHLRVLVRDSGSGMSPDVLARATEPFFTTKAAGHGTGLGLATVHDIVTQSGGALWIESTEGEGTSMWLALPMAGGSAAVLEHQTITRPSSRRGTVLLVEDEPGVRLITRRLLEEAGYYVLLAGDGEEGLRTWHEHTIDRRQRVDLVMTDVVMPEMGGRQMVKEMRAVDGDLAVLYVSGYVEGGLTDEELAGRTAFLAKPFSTDMLLGELAALLGQD